MREKKDWKLYKNVWISPEPVLPGVWQRKDGGHVVRARAKESTTGKMKDLFKVLPKSTAAEALAWLEKEQERARAGGPSVESPRTRFSEFAEALAEHKVAVGEIKSAAGREKWRYTLSHLIGGTEGAKAGRFVEGFGDFFIDRIRTEHVEKWKAGIAGLIAAGDYSPTTANGWFSILCVIMKAAKRKFQLPRLATEDVKAFDTSEHATYTEEEPNALSPEEVPKFLAAMRELYPQHYAMTFIGLITGLRPSTLRPLRRRGPEPDVQWDRARLLVRRSQTIGDEVMQTTKTKRRYAIDLPEEAVHVLRWHVDTQLVTPEMQESDLLFPSVTGKFRSTSVLNDPFADVAHTIGLGKRLTQRGLRRTFQDLARAAAVEGIVTRSISGHATVRMQEHYSTVHGAEQKAALAKVIHLASHREAARGGEHGGEQAPPGGEHRGPVTA
jgi:integrase